MANTAAYDEILDAARRLPPGERLQLAKSLLSGDTLLQFWEGWRERLADEGPVATVEEIDKWVDDVRSRRARP